MTAGQVVRGVAAAAPLARAADPAAAPLARTAADCPNLLQPRSLVPMSTTTKAAAGILAGLHKNRATIEAAETERGDLIAAARRAGVEWADICEATGLVRMTAHRYATKANGGILPKPGDPAPRKRRTTG